MLFVCADADLDADKNVVIIPFCGEINCEERIKELTKVEEREKGPNGEALPSMGMKSLCIPFEQVRTPNYYWSISLLTFNSPRDSTRA